MTRFSLEFKYIKGFGRTTKLPFYEIRLLFLRKVKFLLGFYDLNNNFVFFKFNLFFFYFLFFGVSLKKILKDLVLYDFLILVITGYQLWLKKYSFIFPYFLRKTIYMNLSSILHKILCRRFQSNIVGFTWGRLLQKQMLVIKRLNNGSDFKKLSCFLENI